MKSRPILFSGPMVRALLDGSKTQTRRVVDWKKLHKQAGLPFPTKCRLARFTILEGWGLDAGDNVMRGVDCPYGVPGDRLWVRETYAIMSVDTGTVSVARAERMPPGKTLAETDGGTEVIHVSLEDWVWAESRVDSERWRPSIFMPRWACRIELECMEDARAERLQDITEADAKLEGVEVGNLIPGNPNGWQERGSRRLGFRILWEKLHNKPGERWDDNPELVRVGPFRRLR